MVKRRTTLLALAAACGAVLSRAALGRDPLGRAAEAGAPPAAPAGDALRDDLARMGSHEYSDEGIPVLLACIDVAAEQAGKSAVAASAFSRHFAADFRRYGDAWRQLHPDAPATDVSKVIEVLAERDFAAGGKGGAP